ncbi:LytR/AlgR family response regulator transcription factor [Amedibacillus sp. YH-ame10]
MINLAILDDNVEEASKTKKLLLPYLDKRNLDYERIDIYQDGTSILKCSKMYDVLFLDIEVGTENGIDIAKKLRESQPNIIIVVITSFIKYSIEGYKIRAARYLLKPVAPSLLYSELDEVLKDYLERPSILLSDHHEEVRVKTSDVYYFETYGRKVQFHTRAQVFSSKENVSYWAVKLTEGFVECYKGIYVHVKYIEQIAKDTLVLENKQILPIARRRYDDVKKAWICYQEMIV